MWWLSLSRSNADRRAGRGMLRAATPWNTFSVELLWLLSLGGASRSSYLHEAIICMYMGVLVCMLYVMCTHVHFWNTFFFNFWAIFLITFFGYFFFFCYFCYATRRFALLSHVATFLLHIWYLKSLLIFKQTRRACRWRSERFLLECWDRRLRPTFRHRVLQVYCKEKFRHNFNLGWTRILFDVVK